MSTRQLHSFAFGLATQNSRGDVIEAFYPQPCLHPGEGLSELLSERCDWESGRNGFLILSEDKISALSQALAASGHAVMADGLQQLSASTRPLLACLLSTDAALDSIPEAFLKLHLLSHRLALPHTLNLDGLFGVLRNLAWTNQGPIDLDDLPERQLEARIAGDTLEVYSVDKFPKMTGYVVPTGVRIADTARVRLGAYIGPGTTIMHEGFVNFNAGTIGTAMIEGRISAGVIVGENSDLGGGCSTMGTLSGGGTEVISVGENCLIGANAGIGFPLADGCIIEAGLYVTAGTKVNLLDSHGDLIRTAKAKEISKLTSLLYRRNSLSGAVEAIPLTRSIALNEELHSHN